MTVISDFLYFRRNINAVRHVTAMVYGDDTWTAECACCGGETRDILGADWVFCEACAATILVPDNDDD